jgi:hypothetical protein
MVRAASLFSQIVQQVPRAVFQQLVAKHRAEFQSKGFSCWTQLIAMLFAHVGRADSLREICNGLACCEGKLVHLGVNKAPNKSTLAYANEHRPAELFEELFYTMQAQFRSKQDFGARKAVFRFKNKLLSLDSTTISLCLSLFPWADFRKAKGGVKVHVLLDHDDYMPAWVLITEARQHDIRAARLLDLPKGSIIAMDRGYADYSLYSSMTSQKVFFVSRLKDNALYDVIKCQPVPVDGDIVSDELIILTSAKAAKQCPHMLRRVVVWDPKNDRQIVLLTNHFSLAAQTISAIYKDRWEIELFFKALKQNLKVKSFVGTSENALRIQIWTAMLSLLFLKWLHHLSQARWSFSNLVSMLRNNLFTYRDLMSWLNDPFNTPQQPPGPVQLSLNFTGFGQPNHAC